MPDPLAATKAQIDELARMIGRGYAKRHEAVDPSDFAAKVTASLITHQRPGLTRLLSLGEPLEVLADSWEADRLAERNMVAVLTPVLSPEAAALYEELHPDEDDGPPYTHDDLAADAAALVQRVLDRKRP